MYYPCSENKDSDQLRGYREADLRLCFCLGRLFVFPCGSSFTWKCDTSISFLSMTNHLVNKFVTIKTLHEIFFLPSVIAQEPVRLASLMQHPLT